jgi:hypothetical protein
LDSSFSVYNTTPRLSLKLPFKFFFSKNFKNDPDIETVSYVESSKNKINILANK